MELEKPTKFALEILSSTCWYNLFETYLSYLGCLNCVNFITTMSEQCSKTTRLKLCWKKNLCKIPVKLANFSVNLTLKIPRNLSFFPRPIRSPENSRCLTNKSENIFIFVMEVCEPQCLFQCMGCKQQY